MQVQVLFTAPQARNIDITGFLTARASPLMTDSPELFNISIAVRELAESSRREGGLASPYYGGISGPEGIALHK